MSKGLLPGDRIRLTGGLVGTVTAVGRDYGLMEHSGGMEGRFLLSEATRRAPPEPTWREDAETVSEWVHGSNRPAYKDVCAALARIEKRLAGGES